MSIKALATSVLSDSLGNTGIVTSITLNMTVGELINQCLAIVISFLTIVYMVFKIRNEIKKQKQKTDSE